MTPAYLPLCKVCYLECMAGKSVSITLRDNLGTATYNSSTKKIEFPASVSSSRFPKQGVKRKALLANWKGLPSCEDRSDLSESVSSVKVLFIGSRVSVKDFSCSRDPSSVSVMFASDNLPCLAFSSPDSTLFYVDSGAGQCLCSCDVAFINMSPCAIEITGVAGSLQIYGIGTALFVATDDHDHEVILGKSNRRRT
jgi:hypothetical protein